MLQSLIFRSWSKPEGGGAFALRFFLVYALPLVVMGLLNVGGQPIEFVIVAPVLLAFFLHMKTRRW